MRSLILAIIFFTAFASVPTWAIVVTMSTTVQGYDRITITGQTNLPDSTIVVVVLTRRSDGYSDQARASVENGGFRVGPFPRTGRPLEPGYYDIKVSVPVAWMQPRRVQDVIGKSGEELEGPLVKLSNPFRVNVVEYRDQLIVGNPPPSPQDNTIRDKEVQKHHRDWVESCQNMCDLAQKFADEHGESFDWDACYQPCLDRE